MKKILIILLSAIFYTYTIDFNLNKIPQGTVVKLLKLPDLIPATQSSKLKNVRLEDVTLESVEATISMPAYVQLSGTMDISGLSLPGIATNKKLIMTAALFATTQSQTATTIQPSSVAAQAKKDAQKKFEETARQQVMQPGKLEEKFYTTPDKEGYLRTSENRVYVVDDAGKKIVFPAQITTLFNQNELQNIITIPEFKEILSRPFKNIETFKTNVREAAKKLISDKKYTAESLYEKAGSNILQQPAGVVQKAELKQQSLEEEFYTTPDKDGYLRTSKNRVYVIDDAGKKIILPAKITTLYSQQQLQDIIAIPEFKELLSGPAEQITAKNLLAITKKLVEARKYTESQLSDLLETKLSKPATQQEEANKPRASQVLGNTLEDYVVLPSDAEKYQPGNKDWKKLNDWLYRNKKTGLRYVMAVDLRTGYYLDEAALQKFDSDQIKSFVNNVKEKYFTRPDKNGYLRTSNNRVYVVDNAGNKITMPAKVTTLYNPQQLQNIIVIPEFKELLSGRDDQLTARNLLEVTKKLVDSHKYTDQQISEILESKTSQQAVVKKQTIDELNVLKEKLLKQGKEVDKEPIRPQAEEESFELNVFDPILVKAQGAYLGEMSGLDKNVQLPKIKEVTAGGLSITVDGNVMVGQGGRIFLFTEDVKNFTKEQLLNLTPRLSAQVKPRLATQEDGYLRTSKNEAYIVDSTGKKIILPEKVTTWYSPQELQKLIVIPEFEKLFNGPIEQITESNFKAAAEKLVNSGKYTDKQLANLLETKIVKARRQAENQIKMNREKMGNLLMQELTGKEGPILKSTETYKSPVSDSVIKKSITQAGNILIEAHGRRFLYKPGAEIFEPYMLGEAFKTAYHSNYGPYTAESEPQQGSKAIREKSTPAIPVMEEEQAQGLKNVQKLQEQEAAKRQPTTAAEKAHLQEELNKLARELQPQELEKTQKAAVKIKEEAPPEKALPKTPIEEQEHAAKNGYIGKVSPKYAAELIGGGKLDPEVPTHRAQSGDVLVWDKAKKNLYLFKEEPVAAVGGPQLQEFGEKFAAPSDKVITKKSELQQAERAQELQAKSSQETPQEQVAKKQLREKIIEKVFRNKFAIGAQSIVGGALFTARLDTPDYKPFGDISMDAVDAIMGKIVHSITLDNSELGFYISPAGIANFFVDGSGSIFNIPLMVRLFINLEPGNSGLVLQAGLPKVWKFSDSFPTLKTLDFLEIKKAYAYISSIRYIDYSIATQMIPGAGAGATVSGRPSIGITPGIELRPGVSVYGEINLKKLLPFLKEYEAGLETASLYGTVSWNPDNVLFGVGLPDLIKLSGKGPFKSAGTWVEIRGTPSVAIIVAFTFIPSSQDGPLTLTGRFNMGTEEAIVAFTLQGVWENVFGINGLALSNLAIQVNANYKLLIASGLPSALGMIGTIELGKIPNLKKITLAGKFDTTNVKDFALQGKLEGTITMREVLETCETLAANSIKTVAHAVTKSTAANKTIDDITREFNVIMNAPVVKQLVDIEFKDIEVTLAPQPVRIGEIVILQGFTIKGACKILGVDAHLVISVSKSGLLIEGYLSPINLGGIFKLTGTGRDKKFGTPDDGAIISCALNMSDQHFIISGVVEFLGMSEQTQITLDKDGYNCFLEGKLWGIFEAATHIYTRGSIKNPDVYFKSTMKNDIFKFLEEKVFRELDKVSSELRGKVGGAVKTITKERDKLDVLNNQIRDFDRQINERKKKIDSLSGNVIEGIKNSPEIIKLGFEVTGLEIAKGSTIAARETAKGTMTAGAEVTKALGEGASQILELPEKVFFVKECLIEESLQNFVRGKLPHVKLTYMLLNKEYKLDLELDLSSKEKAAHSAEEVARQVLKSLTLGKV
ncbi:MAG: cell envelope integrity protein TolA [Candidatus Babeliaceae bacterium]|jgi:hypothetical protein